METTQITSERYLTAYRKTPGLIEKLKKRCGEFDFMEYQKV